MSRKEKMAKILVKHQVAVRTYEITYLVGGSVTSSELAAIRDEVVALVGKYAGKIQDTQDWGKKDLAYPIKDEGKTHTEAYYTHLVAEIAADKIAKFTQELEMKKGIIRDLVIAAV